MPGSTRARRRHGGVRYATRAQLTRGLTRDAALAAQPAVKGRRAGQAVRYRDLSLTRARRLILAAVRSGKASCKALTSQIAKFRTIPDRDRHRARKSKSPSTFGHAGPKDTITRTAPTVITMANKPARQATAGKTQNSANSPSGQRKPPARRCGTPVTAMPGNRRPHTVTRRETTHQGLKA